MQKYKLYIIEIVLVIKMTGIVNIKRTEEKVVTMKNECLSSNFQCFIIYILTLTKSIPKKI